MSIPEDSIQWQTLQQQLKRHLELEQFSQAETLLKQWTQRFPENARLRIYTGLIYYRQSSFPEALSEFRKAGELDPDSAEGTLCIIAALCDLGCYHWAREIASGIAGKAQMATPANNPGNLNELARKHARTASCYEKIGRNSQAVSEYQQAIRLNPGHETSRISLARIWIGEGDLQKARKELLELLEYSPLHCEAHTWLGIISSKEGKKELARKSWEKAHHCDTKNSVAQAYSRLARSWKGNQT
ncbi:MAG: tetratricopeptide repeat protein [Deltaproteobacteria bacterium]|nr:tetratricopeptide repeat protein [Deltaproteobacteria bacterium]